MKMSRFFCILLTICLVGGCFCLITEAKADTVYNAHAAVNYAVAHWDDGIGACDQFVKACLKAGGINITVGTVDNVRAALLNYGTEYTVEFRNGVCYQQDNPNITVGDIIFYYCSTCGNYPHTAIITKMDDNGVFYFSQHNGAFLNLKFTTGFHDGHGHRDPYITYKVVHIPSTPYASIQVSFRDPVYFVTSYSARFHQYWTITKNGQAAEPDEFFYYLYTASGNFVGRVSDIWNGVRDPDTQECNIFLEPDTEYSVETHVIVDSREFISPRYAFTTTNDTFHSVDFRFSDNAKEPTEFGIKVRLNLEIVHEPAKPLNGYGWRLFDDEDNLVYEQSYIPGVYDPAGTIYRYYDGRGNWEDWSPSDGIKAGYIVSIYLDIEKDFTDCVLKTGRTYHFVPYATLGGENYYDSVAREYKTLYFTTVSHTPDTVGCKLYARATGATGGNLGGQIGGTREDGKDVRYPHTYSIYLDDEDGFMIGYLERQGSGDSFRIFVENIDFDTQRDFGMTLSPGRKYQFTLEAHWDDYTYVSDTFEFYTKSIVHYDANGGSGAPADLEKPYGEAVELSEAEPARPGYEFLGWALSAGAVAPQYQPGVIFNLDGEITLYAIWNLLEPNLVLPDGLTRIDEEAFIGGAFTFISVPRGVTTIASGAFADCPNLRHIRFANANTIIDANAFGSTRNIVIHAKEGGYVEFFASKYGFTFVAE